MALNENYKKIMLELGYEGGFELAQLIEDVDPCFRTLTRLDNGRYSAAGGAIFVGFIDGEETPEDAVACLWIRATINFKTKPVKKPRKKRESKIKYKGD